MPAACPSSGSSNPPHTTRPERETGGSDPAGFFSFWMGRAVAERDVQKRTPGSQVASDGKAAIMTRPTSWITTNGMIPR